MPLVIASTPAEDLRPPGLDLGAHRRLVDDRDQVGGRVFGGDDFGQAGHDGSG
jgi:hypothetical protein